MSNIRGLYLLGADGLARRVSQTAYSAYRSYSDREPGSPIDNPLQASRLVAETRFPGLAVVTEFRGIDDGQESAPPALWVTGVLPAGSKFWAVVRRYATRAEAESGHDDALRAICSLSGEAA